MNAIEITIKIRVPEGPICYFENGQCCSQILRHTGSGQRWCRAFNDAKLSDGLKCRECAEACKKAGDKSEVTS